MLFGLFRTLMKPDYDEDPERSLVAQAANILEIGEFQLLQLAYQEWHGAEMSDSVADRLFKAYMIRSEVPAWARHYARRIIRQDEIDLIDANDPGYHRYDQGFAQQVPKTMGQFFIACLFIVTVLLGGILIGHQATSSTSSVLPPYFEDDELFPQR